VETEETEGEGRSRHGERTRRDLGRKRRRIAGTIGDEGARPEEVGGEAAGPVGGVELEGLAQAARGEGGQEERGGEARGQGQGKAAADPWGHRRLLFGGDFGLGLGL
jgi:hypothetical protein